MPRDEIFKRYATEYDPIKIGSIDGTDTEPHDRALIRAINSEYSCNKLVKGDPYRTLFVGRLNPRTTEKMLESEFSRFGEIRNIRLVKDIVTGMSKRYAFIEFKSLNSVDEAISSMHKEDLNHSQIIVELEAERRLRGWRPRRLGGGFGGMKESGQLRFGCKERPFAKPIHLQKYTTDVPRKFKGWCQSFTRTERVLTVLEAVLLVFLVMFLIFLILHLLVCSTPGPKYVESEQPKQYEEVEYEETETPTVPIKHETTTARTGPETTSTKRQTTMTASIPHQTIDPELECSWTPSAKTTALTHYYENIGSHPSNDYTNSPAHIPTKVTRKITKQHDARLDNNVDFIQVDQSDGEDAEPMQNQYILSLVKLKPPQNVGFGCILTVIGNYWMLTSASCIEAIEEVDSLDSFVIMEDYGTTLNGKIHSILDVQIHPFYQGTNRSYDLAIIKSESSPVNGKAVELPTLLDTSMITIGERFHILGFGAYRSIDRGPRARRLRKVYAYRVPGAQCAASGGAWAARHLEAGRPEPRVASGPLHAGLCAGVLYARGLPCNYCGGAPLLHGPRLLAIMADNAQCGVACEPQLYVNIAAVRDWIDAVVSGQ